MSVLKIREKVSKLRNQLGFSLTVEIISIVIFVMIVASKSGTRIGDVFVGSGEDRASVLGKLETFMENTFDDVYGDGDGETP